MSSSTFCIMDSLNLLRHIDIHRFYSNSTMHVKVAKVKGIVLMLDVDTGIVYGVGESFLVNGYFYGGFKYHWLPDLAKALNILGIIDDTSLKNTIAEHNLQLKLEAENLIIEDTKRFIRIHGRDKILSLLEEVQNEH